MDKKIFLFFLGHVNIFSCVIGWSSLDIFYLLLFIETNSAFFDTRPAFL